VTGSLCYRQNTADILAGNPPAKYTRILPFIPGEKVIEVGSAEGVLACLMARQGRTVTAIEAHKERHKCALALAQKWGVSGVTFVNGRLETQKVKPGDYDTLVAVRMIYYLRDQIDAVFAEVAKKVPNIVLCGNKGRAKAYHAGRPHEPLGKFNYYASAEGMRDLLTRHGYEIAAEVTEGDAIVVGRLK
jgi:16S rRNA G527 N7-methylase RsmG